MRDRNLERNIRRVEEFVERWKTLGQLMDRGLRGESIVAEDETVFLELKSAIAQEHEVLLATLGTSAERDDRVLKLLNLMPSLTGLREMDEDAAKKLSTDWHTVYLRLQALLGRLKGQQAQLASISTLRLGAKRVFTNPVLVVLVFAAAAYGVYKFVDEWLPKLAHLKEQLENRQ